MNKNSLFNNQVTLEGLSEGSFKVSCLTNFFDSEPISRTIEDVCRLAAAEATRQRTEKIRQLRAIAFSEDTPIVEADKAKKELLRQKNQLPSFMPNVLCENGKKRENIQRFTQAIGFDVDHISECLMEQLMNRLRADEHVLFAQPSCSRKGVHFLLATDTADWLNARWDGKDAKPFAYVWREAKDYVTHAYQIEVDENCKNPERILGICFDELTYYNPQPTPLHIATDRYAEPAPANDATAAGSYPPPSPSDLRQEMLDLADLIVASGRDITAGYTNWLKLGFALADGLGEEGRSIYHNLSRANAGYDPAACDKQYTACLNGKRQGTTSKSFFQLAKESGIDLSRFAKARLRQRGDSLGQAILDSQTDTVGQDKMILGSLNVISGILPKTVYSIYDRNKVYPPLYNIIYGGFASKKGDLKACKQLVAPIQREMNRQYEQAMEDYEVEQAQWEAAPKATRGKAPAEPVRRSHFLPANSSASAVYRLLKANGGAGGIFDTEADSMTNMLSKSDYGDYSDLLRKAHHHEHCSMARVADNTYIEIEEPRLAVFLTCTGSQIPLLLNDSNIANGLASRFLFYALPTGQTEFRDVFANNDITLDDIYKEIGQQIYRLYTALKEREADPIQFVMTTSQEQAFVETFKEMLKEKTAMYGEGIDGFIFRLALECYRYAMLLTLLRRLSARQSAGEPLFEDTERAIACDDRDLHIAMTLIECLMNHTARVYAVLGTPDSDPFAKAPRKPSPDLRAFYEALPAQRPFTA